MTLFAVLLDTLLQHHADSRARAARVARGTVSSTARVRATPFRVGLLTLLLALIPA